MRKIRPMEITEKDVSETEKIIKEARRRPATLSELMSKKRRTKEVTISSIDEDGYELELLIKFQALSPKEFDDLIAAYPPTPKQKTDGMSYNPDTFGPALVAACALEPKMTVAEVTAIIDSGTWSPGEVNTLTGGAMSLCQTGAHVPFTERD